MTTAYLIIALAIASFAFPTSDGHVSAREALHENERLTVWIQEDARNAALGQFVKAGRRLASDFVGLRLDASKRDEFLNSYDVSSSAYDSISVPVLKVVIYGDTAVVSGVVMARDSTKASQSISTYRYTRVYANQDNKWRPVYVQLTKIPEESVRSRSMAVRRQE